MKHVTLEQLQALIEMAVPRTLADRIWLRQFIENLAQQEQVERKDEDARGE